MDLTTAIELCLSLPCAEETTPFGPDTLVYKTHGKVFAITSPENHPPFINLKCDPERSALLRDQYEGITPAYHMNKKHWNSVLLDGSIPSHTIAGLIRHSFDLIWNGLPRKIRESHTGEQGDSR